MTCSKSIAEHGGAEQKLPERDDADDCNDVPIRQLFDLPPELLDDVLAKAQALPCMDVCRAWRQSMAGQQQLQLSSCKLMVQDAHRLRLMTGLRRLVLSDCRWCPIGLAALAWALEGLTGLQELDLRRVRELHGLTLLAPPLKAMTGLRRLALPNCDISGQRGAALNHVLAGLTGLQELDLSLATGMCYSGLALLVPSLKVMTGLQDLNLAGRECFAEAPELASALEDKAMLRRLNLSRTSIGCAGCAAAVAQALRGMPRLQSLVASRSNFGMQGASLCSALEVLSELQALDLSGNYLGRSAAAAVATAFRSMTGLRRLVLSDCYFGWQVSASLARALGDLSGLQELDLSCTTELKEMMWELALLAPPLKAMTGLQELNLSGQYSGSSGSSKVGDAAAAAAVELVCALDGMAMMRRLHLNDYSFGPEAFAVLVAALQGMPRLQGLHLARITHKTAVPLLRALEVLTELEMLDLSENNLGPSGAAALDPALRSMPRLRWLSLHGNCIGPEGAAALAQALQGHPGLQSLVLTNNSIGTAGTDALARDLHGLRRLLIDGSHGYIIARTRSRKR